MNFQKLFVVAAFSGLISGTVARAGFIINGNFETYTGGNSGAPSQLNDTGTSGYTNLTGWTVGPGNSGTYAFLMNPSTHDSLVSGSYSPRFTNFFRLWGPNSGSANGLTGSPTGGNYVALDSDLNYRGSGMSQVITGLTIGTQYRVEFDWAAAQQHGYDGATVDRVQVTFGGQTQSTADVTIPNHGFSGWMHQAFDFTATSTTQTLNFLAIGGQAGGGTAALPPFVLLDGLSLDPVTNTPEPATLATMSIGVMTLAGIGLRRRSRAKLTAG